MYGKEPDGNEPHGPHGKASHREKSHGQDHLETSLMEGSRLEQILSHHALAENATKTGPQPAAENALKKAHRTGKWLINSMAGEVFFPAALAARNRIESVRADELMINSPLPVGPKISLKDVIALMLDNKLPAYRSKRWRDSGL